MPTRADGVEIREARGDEVAAAGALTLAGYLADTLIDPEHPYTHELADATDRARLAALLVAVEPGGPVLGTVTFCRPGSPYAELARPGEAEFRMLAVAPSARGRGIGEALVHACIERARAAGDRAVVLSTQATMRAAARLYERLGFRADPSRNWSPVPGVDLLAYERAVDLSR